MKTLKIGIVGGGGMGKVHYANWKAIEDIEIVAEENEFFNVTDYLVYYDEDGNAWFGTATVTDNDGNNVQMINYIFKVEKSSYNVKITVKNDTKVIGTRNIKVKKA